MNRRQFLTEISKLGAVAAIGTQQNDSTYCSYLPVFSTGSGSMGVNGLSGLSALSAVCRSAYNERVLTTRTANLLAYWPLWETGGATAVDISGNGSNGTYTGPSYALGQPGIGDGRPSVLLNADAVDLYSVSLRDEFNGSSGTFAMWVRVTNAGVWTDGMLRYAVNLNASGGAVRITKSSINNLIQMSYTAGGVTQYLNAWDRYETGWMHLALAWDKAANSVRAYVNGSLVVVPQTGLGVWDGTLSTGTTCLGARRSDSLADPWQGGLGHASLWSVALTGQEIQALHDSFRPVSGLFCLGDSKTLGDSWVRMLCNSLGIATGVVTEERPLRYGFSGATIATMKAHVDANLASEDQQPTWALINIGSVEVYLGLPAAATWQANLASVIDALRAKWPEIQVYVARVWFRGRAAECNTLAEWIAAVVGGYASGVHLGMDERVWLEGGDDGATMSSDGDHYSAMGQVVCVEEWMTAMGY